MTLPLLAAAAERAEVVALLFNVSDIGSALERIERLLEEDDDEGQAEPLGSQPPRPRSTRLPESYRRLRE